MLRKTLLGLVAMVGLLAVSTGTASAYGGYHHGYRGCYGGGYGYRTPYYGYRGGYGYGYRPYAPVVVNPAPVYAYPPAAGYAPGYGYGYAPGFGVTTPGFGMYVR